ncbi:recombinase family protein [Streptomyces roseolilacinus]|uniref:hypothetical protein n=1 Tax=Streptomyces roseolilacinus TaxID=66904 RepID=UPI0038102FCB
MQLLCKGDTLKATRLDRLSRSVLHLVPSVPNCAGEASACTSSSKASTPPPWRVAPCSGCRPYWPSSSAS